MTERPQLEVIERLQHVFAAGKTRALGWRLAQLAGLRRMLVEREEELGAAVKETLGRSAFGTWLTETGFVLSEIEFVSRRLPRWLQPRKVRTVPASRPGRSYVMREPYGVALVISPWNFPLQLALSPLIGAVSAGNCVLIKPSEAAPAVSALLARLLPEYLDADAVAVIEGDATATQALLRGPVDCVHFTGSRTVGRKVMAAAAEKPVPVILELGGKCPCIIHDSADLKLAARRIAWGKFLNAGQICVAPDYVLVPSALEAAFLDELKRAVIEFYGSDAAQSPDYARIINRPAFERLSALLKDGELVAGGGTDPDQLYIAPTIMRRPAAGSAVLTDEIFGPILPVIAYDNLSQAEASIAALPEPLAVYLFCRDRQVEREVIARTRSGSVCVNDVILQLANLRLPFGGVGASGFGQYHGQAGFEAFSWPRSVVLSHPFFDLPMRYPPYTFWRRQCVKWLSRLIS